jgi:Ca2+-binding RTX toxin-like protein
MALIWEVQMATLSAILADPNVNGTSDGDFITGNDLANLLRGFSGSDTIFGKGGNDKLYGDEGSDRLYGDGGADRLFGGLNNDYLFGGSGADQLHGEAGNDQLTGNTGADTYYFVRDGGKDTVTDLNPSEGDAIVFGDGVNLRFSPTGVTKGTTYQEFDFNFDRKIDQTVVYLAYAGDTSGNSPDYITFSYANWADVRATLPAGELFV